VNHLEDAEQKALIQWANKTKQNINEIGRYLFAIPNGGKRDKREAVRLKAQGVKAGVSDLFYPVARGGYFGLWIEMKVGRNKPTEKQKVWLRDMDEQGFLTAVCYNWLEARDIIKNYLLEPETQTID